MKIMDNMKFNRTTFVLEKFSSLLSQSKSKDDEELKSYFTGYVLVIFYSEFEDKLKTVFKEVLHKYSTEELAIFISKAMDHIFNRLAKKDIEKTIAYFGDEKKDKFRSLIQDKLVVWEKYQKFIENRHNVAHSNNPISLSWEEMIDETNQKGAEKSIDKVGEEIISVVRESLEL